MSTSYEIQRRAAAFGRPRWTVIVRHHTWLCDERVEHRFRTEAEAVAFVSTITLAA